MKRTSLLFAVLLISQAPLLLPAQYNRANLSLEMAEAEEKYSFDKLRIYPITANRVFLEAHKSIGDYKPLKAGIADGTVKIVERGAEEALSSPVQVVAVPDQNPAPAPVNVDAPTQNNDGHVRAHEQYQGLTQENLEQVRVNSHTPHMNQTNNHINVLQLNNNANGNVSNRAVGDEVNRLFIENTGNDTIFIMAGEVVKGGKQDRVIASDMVIPPHSAPIDLSVFCVEHGRWTYGGADASDGFTGHASVANTSVRKAAITAKDQSEVWEQVAVVTKANNATSSTGTLNALEKNEDYQKELKAYEARFASLPSTAPSVIGVVAVTGDRVIGCDMFATPDLFRNAYPDLLKSYVSEAISSGAKVSIGNDAVDKYISDILDESKQKQEIMKKGQFFEEKGKTMHISTF
jgi:hypothetical protein